MFKIHKHSLMLTAAVMGFSLIAAAGLLAVNWPVAAPANASLVSTDLNVIQDAYGSSEGEANYNAAADLNDDGVVNLMDKLELKNTIAKYDLNGDGVVSLATSTPTDFQAFYDCWLKDSSSADWADCEKADFDEDGGIGILDFNNIKAAWQKYDLNGDGVVNTSAEELPDLTVENIYFNASVKSEKDYLSVVIKNLGGDLKENKGLLNWSHNFGDNHFTYSTLSGDADSVISYETDRPLPSADNPLEKNETITFSWYGYFDSSGDLSIEYTVDGTNELSESNENNNSLTKTITISNNNISISSVSVSNIKSSEATISWTTSEAVSSRIWVWEGSGKAPGDQPAFMRTMSAGTNQSIAATNLKPSTLYTYQITALQNELVVAESTVKEFTTQASEVEVSHCTDSDGGKNYFVKGEASSTIIINNNTTGAIDTCSGDNLYETICGADGVAQQVVYKCENGCNDGACIKAKEESRPTRYRHAKWECADGTSFEKEDGNSCKTEATWKNIAKNSCKNSEIKEFEVEKECGSESTDDQIETIRDRAKDLFENKFDAMRAEINELRDIIKEQQTQIKYLVSLKKDVKKLSEKVESAINNFITYGVDENTKKLGAGERAAVMNSFKQAFNKLPETEDELSDAIKIANGRWPSMTSEEAEKEAKAQFEKIYKHVADMDNAHDNAAVTVMAYGLRQKAENRNLNSEKQGIQTFMHIYGYHPSSTEDWNIMQAITYSGASRGVDTDGDLLLDEREAELGTDPNNPDSDGDGFKDGVEVANGFDPLKK